MITMDETGTQSEVSGVAEGVVEDGAVVEQQKQIAEVQRRYRVCAGRILIARQQVPTTDTGEYVASQVVTSSGRAIDILGTQERGKINQLFEPWGEVLMIGDRFNEGDYRPDVRVGQRVYFSPTGARDIELSAGGETMTVAMVPFEAILLLDDGPAVDTSNE